MTTRAEVKRKKINDIIERVQHLSPFELKDELIHMAKQSEQKGVRIMLNAGRGNPNWTAATPRQAFFTFGQFAILETQRSLNIDDLAGMVQKNGIAKRLLSFINDNPSLPGINLISKIYDYRVNTLGFNEDEWIFELADRIIGDNYPVPDRMLVNIEKLVNK